MDDDDIGTVRWFGDSWHAPVNDPRARVESPVDQRCIHCHLWIGPADRGVTIPYLNVDTGPTTVAYHLKCFLDEIGVPHV